MKKSFFTMFTEFAEQCHRQMVTAGYWKEDDATPRMMPIKMARIHGEVSELVEVYRKGKMHLPCGKPCGLTCEEEEYADIILQVIDSAAARGIDIGAAVEAKALFNAKRAHSKDQGKNF